MKNTNIVQSDNDTSTNIAISEELTQLIRKSVAPNTMKAYRNALTGIQTYLSDHNIEFSDSTLAAYITYLHGQGRAPSSISIVVAAARWQLRNENKDYDLPVTTRTLAGIRREGRDRGRGQVTGLDWQQTERVCAFAESENMITGLRDSAMIRLMSDCLLCVSEVVAVDVSDFEKQTLIVHLSKTDQEGSSVALYVTSETKDIIEKYQTRGSITSGALFCRIRRGSYSIRTIDC